MMSAAESLFARRLRADEDTAYEELIRVHLASIYRVACRMLRNPEEAANVTVDAFIRVFRNIGHYSGECSLRTWILRIAFSELGHPLRRIRHRSRRSTPSVATAVPPRGRRHANPRPEIGDRESSLEPFAEVEPEVMAREEAIRTALEKLPWRRRSVIVLRDIEGFSYEEIADILGISTDAVRLRLARARAGLKKDLMRYLSVRRIG